jgi:hypothetical protein
MARESILEQPPETVIAFQKSPCDRRLPRGKFVIGLLLDRGRFGRAEIGSRDS